MFLKDIFLAHAGTNHGMEAHHLGIRELFDDEVSFQAWIFGVWAVLWNRNNDLLWFRFWLRKDFVLVPAPDPNPKPDPNPVTDLNPESDLNPEPDLSPEPGPNLEPDQTIFNSFKEFVKNLAFSC
jgi:hypothetical protein